MLDPTGQTATWDTIINGIFIGASILAAIVTAGLFLSAAVPLWTGIGIAATAIVDSVAAGIATAQIIDDNVEGVDFITDKDSEILTWAGVAFGIASLGLTTAAGAAAKTGLKAARKNLKATKAVTSSSNSEPSGNGIRNMFGDRIVGRIDPRSSLATEFTALDSFPKPLLQDLSDFMKKGEGKIITGPVDTKYNSELRNIYLRTYSPAYHPLRPKEVLAHEFGHTWAHMKLGTPDGSFFPQDIKTKLITIRGELGKYKDSIPSTYSKFSTDNAWEYLQEDHELLADLFVYHYRTPTPPTHIYDSTIAAELTKSIFESY
jgi:hypothetical protein